MVESYREDGEPNARRIVRAENPLPVTSYLLEVARQNVPGSESEVIIGIGDNINTTEAAFGDAFTTRYQFQTTSVALEILSDNANDTLLGTGARTVLLTTMGDDFVEVSQTIDMNGTTPVSVPINCRRVNRAVVIAAGSGESNEGLIVARVVSGAIPQRSIEPSRNLDADGIFTIPAGKTAYIFSVSAGSEKGKDILMRLNVRSFGGLFLQGGPVPAYQNSLTNDFPVPLRRTEKGDVEMTAQATQANTRGISIITMLIEENVT